MFAEMPVRTGFRIVLSFCENTYNFTYFLFFFIIFGFLHIWIEFHVMMVCFSVLVSEKVKFEVLFLCCSEKLRILLQPS
jgi:hypothetical protein